MFGLTFYCKMTKKPIRVSIYRKRSHLHFATCTFSFSLSHHNLDHLQPPSSILYPFSSNFSPEDEGDAAAGRRSTKEMQQVAGARRRCSRRSPEQQTVVGVADGGRSRSPEQRSEKGIYVFSSSKRTYLIKKSGSPDFSQITFPS